jgi:hypothetical protein
MVGNRIAQDAGTARTGVTPGHGSDVIQVTSTTMFALSLVITGWSRKGGEHAKKKIFPRHRHTRHGFAHGDLRL